MALLALRFFELTDAELHAWEMRAAWPPKLHLYAASCAVQQGFNSEFRHTPFRCYNLGEA